MNQRSSQRLYARSKLRRNMGENCELQLVLGFLSDCSEIFISGKEIMFSVALVYLSLFLSVCLSVSDIIQKVMNRLQRNFMEGSRVVKGMSD